MTHENPTAPHATKRDEHVTDDPRTPSSPASTGQPCLFKRWRRLLVVALFLVVGWVALAVSSGVLFTPETQLACQPGEFTHDGFSNRKKIANLPSSTVAYVDQGQGPPVILLHGCPFSVYEWHKVIPPLAEKFRVIAPDLLGLGDTPVSLNADYRLPQDVQMVIELMDSLGIDSAAFVTHDHGAATLQLLMDQAPQRVTRAVISNAEAYDLWPSGEEKLYLHFVVNPITSPVFYWALKLRPVRREVFSIAIHDQTVLTDEMVDAFADPLTSSRARWARLRRFFAWQLDPEHNRLTLDCLPAMRSFEKPVLLLWGERDENFGKPIAQRLARDIPGTVGLQWMEKSAHMPMLEEPEKYADYVIKFLTNGQTSPQAKQALRLARNP